MQKAGLFRIIFLVLTIYLGLGKSLLAQTPVDTMGFRWKLLEVTDPTVETKIIFTPTVNLPLTTFSSWDFGDGNTSTDSIATHSFTTLDTFDVKYNFKVNSVDSTITRKVIANTANFFVRLDSITNATYVRILRSEFVFPDNEFATIGNMRFEWSVNGTVLTDYDYTPAGNGQYPNIRYTFEHGGANTVTLRVWNTADAAKDVTLSRVLNIQPDFTTKVKLNVPNVFTPNGDGVYDFFEVQTSGTSRLVFKVFTRTGALVYQNEATYIKWDGKNENGRELPEGIYYYIIEDRDKNYENAKGFVYIFRGKK